MAEKQGFRPDIQGLRAVAALLVCVYHLWLGRVSGGVDVFFVVSGFLITGMLVRQWDRHGRLDVPFFWSHLIRRLLPAAVVVVLLTCLGAFWLLPKVEWKSTIKEAAASITYLENWLLAFDAVDYLARETPPSPLQHFWALSTQGQIYLLWPLLMMLALGLVRAGRVKEARVALGGVLLLVLAGSLAWSVVSTAQNQAFAYFDTRARLWEFALGGLLAIPRNGVRVSGPAGAWLGWVGLLGVVSCGLVLQVSTVFPGYAALWPTLGAVLILVAGADRAWGVHRVLRARPLQFFGGISYAFYLWHWPLLILYRAYSGTQQVDLVEGSLILLGAAVLAWLTARFVERPLRFGRFPGPRPVPVFAFGAGCLVLTALLLSPWALYTLRLQAGEMDAATRIGSSDYPGAGSLMPGYSRGGAQRVPPLPGPFSIKDDMPVSYQDKVHQRALQDEVLLGEYGKPDGRYRIALVGGSHSAQWLPALQAVADRLDLRILNLTKSGCWFSDAYWSSHNLEGAGQSCQRWNRQLMQALEQLRPDAVFTTLTRAQGEEVIPHPYIDKWRQVEALGIDVIAIRDTPWYPFDPTLCVDVFGSRSRRCQLPREQSLAQQSPAAVMTDLPARLRQIDLTPYFCDAQKCSPVIGNVMVYRDSNHLSASYARTLGPALEPYLREWLVDRAAHPRPAEQIARLGPQDHPAFLEPLHALDK